MPLWRFRSLLVSFRIVTVSQIPRFVLESVDPVFHLAYDYNLYFIASSSL